MPGLSSFARCFPPIPNPPRWLPLGNSALSVVADLVPITAALATAIDAARLIRKLPVRCLAGSSVAPIPSGGRVSNLRRSSPFRGCVFVGSRRASMPCKRKVPVPGQRRPVAPGLPFLVIRCRHGGLARLSLRRPARGAFRHGWILPRSSFFTIPHVTLNQRPHDAVG